MNDFFLEDFKFIGKKIKEKRKKKGLSQEALANKIPKLDRAKISDMENGKEDFYISTLFKICYALDTDLQSLLKSE